MATSIEDLNKISDIGVVCSESIYNYFHNENNINMINELKELGLNTKYLGKTTVDENSFFYNKKVVLTGTLSKYGRKEATELLENLGAHVSSSVSKVTNIVIYGEEAGSKLDKARKLNVYTMSEDEFINKLEEENEKGN